MTLSLNTVGLPVYFEKSSPIFCFHVWTVESCMSMTIFCGGRLQMWDYVIIHWNREHWCVFNEDIRTSGGSVRGHLAGMLTQLKVLVGAHWPTRQRKTQWLTWKILSRNIHRKEVMSQIQPASPFYFRSPLWPKKKKAHMSVTPPILKEKLQLLGWFIWSSPSMTSSSRRVTFSSVNHKPTSIQLTS